MADNRSKLEKKAKDLGLDFDPELTDENLLALINQAQNEADAEDEPDEADEPADDQKFSKDFKFYKSPIHGLAVQVGAPEDRSELHQELRFTSYLEYNEAKGEHYRTGYLATDEPDVIEVLSDDPNVTEISEKEYKEAIAASKKITA